MLVLSRKVGEQIKIGNDIVITITRLQGGSVKMGISAPRSVRVTRGELSELACQASQTEGAKVSGHTNSDGGIETAIVPPGSEEKPQGAAASKPEIVYSDVISHRPLAMHLRFRAPAKVEAMSASA